MPIAVVQTGTHLSNNSGSSVNYTTSTRPTAGNFVALLMYNRRAAGLANPNVTDNQGNTWQVKHVYISGTTSGPASSIYFVPSIAMPNAGQLTVTISSPDTVSYDMDFIELNGVDPTVPIRDEGSGTTASTVTSLTVNSLSTSAQIGDFILATLKAGHTSGTANITNPTGYTQIGIQNSASTASVGQSCYRTVAVAGTQTVAWTFGSAANHIGQLLVLRPAVPFIGLVQNSSRIVADFTATSAFTTTTRPVAGNTMTVQGFLFAFNPTFTLSVTDNQSGTWTVYQTQVTTGSTAANAFVAVCNNITMPNAGQLTITLTPSVPVFYVWSMSEWSNVATSSPLRVTATNQATTSTSSLAVTTDATPQVGDLIVGSFKVETSATDAAIVTPSGYTSLVVSQDDAAENAGEASYKIVTANGAQSQTWTYTAAPVAMGRNVVLRPQSTVRVRALLEPSAANLSSLKVSIWNMPTGTDLHGTHIGQYINQATLSTVDGQGNAVLDVQVGSGFPLSAGSNVKVYATNGTYTSGIIDGVVQ